MKYQGKERRGVAKGEENEWEREERNNFEIKAIRFFFFWFMSRDKNCPIRGRKFCVSPVERKKRRRQKILVSDWSILVTWPKSLNLIGWILLTMNFEILAFIAPCSGNVKTIKILAFSLANFGHVFEIKLPDWWNFYKQLTAMSR